MILIIMIGVFSCDDNNSPNSKVQSSPWDASVYQVKNYLKDNYKKAKLSGKPIKTTF